MGKVVAPEAVQGPRKFSSQLMHCPCSPRVPDLSPAS